MITDRVGVGCPVAAVITVPPQAPAALRGGGCCLWRTSEDRAISGNNLLVFCCVRRLRGVLKAAFAVAASEAEDRMIALFLLLVIAAIAVGIVGVVAKGVLFLLFIGIVVFLGALVLGALRMRRRPGGRPGR